MTVISKPKVLTANTVSATAGGFLGSYGVTNGTLNWTATNKQFSNGSNPVMTLPHGKNTVQIEEHATLEVKGHVRINGVDLEERLRTIEKVLAIPERDVILEKKHPKLKEMYDEYINALQKYKTWNTLKDSK